MTLLDMLTPQARSAQSYPWRFMPPPDLCRVVRLEAYIPAISNLIGHRRAA